jgi:cGMP-dependent protein kinase
MSSFTESQFAAGETIFTAGQVADRLYFIRQGRVTVLASDGSTIATAGQGDSFGEQAFLRGGIRGATVVATEAVTCIVISGEDANAHLSGASPLLVPLFEALLLQQNMQNDLARSAAD